MRTKLPLLLLTLLCACEQGTWQTLSSGLDEALMSVSGSSPKDVWAVGADQGRGPLVLHYDGAAWEKRATGEHGNLWWVQAFPDGTALMAGERGMVLKWTGSAFERQATPGFARQTVFGLWGASSDDVWAVGSSTNGRNGFLWHFDGAAWAEVPLPDDVPRKDGELPGLFKVWGTGADDVWAVGADGTVLHKSGSAWARVESGRRETLFAVWGTGGKVFVVGGGAQAVLLERAGDGFRDVSPTAVSLLQGVSATPAIGYAVGEGGAVYRYDGASWAEVRSGLKLDVESLHAVWVDSEGGTWAVGGKVLTTLKGGVLVHFGRTQAGYTQPAPPTPPAVVCPPAAIDPAEGKSAARRWDEQILSAIRRDTPRPTVHARNLYHLSAAMWDAWAAFSPSAVGVFTNERVTPADVAAAREEAISYAAYRVLDARYAKAVGGPTSRACFQALLRKQGYDPDDTVSTGDSPRAVGNRIAAAVLAASADDGSNAQNNYADTTGFKASSAPLSVEGVMAPVADVDAWQPLDLAVAATQNGIPLAAGVQGYIGAHWGKVTPFALTRPAPGALYVDPGPAPKVTAATMGWAVEAILRSSQLEPDPSRQLDISPGAYGNNPVGSNAGTGHPLNPFTGKPYTPERVALGDFGRVLAETWADGPKSETPPGHWNAIANTVADAPGFARKWKGEGEALPALEWDVRLYLALNGAVHDAAIVAWEVKRAFACSRPITIIRGSALRGQSSDPGLPRYDARGLPLTPGLIELITPESSRPGERHAHLKAFVGEVAIRAWRGEPGDITRQVSGTGWVRGVSWQPYQKRNFVTPAFPGFISGHSTFSRAAAEVLTAATGSAFFPGGLGQQVVPARTALTFEQGPSTEVVLQWATYFDAADQAGQSRIWGGIHIEPDDFAGRRAGQVVGLTAFAKAERFFR